MVDTDAPNAQSFKFQPVIFVDNDGKMIGGNTVLTKETARYPLVTPVNNNGEVIGG